MNNLTDTLSEKILRFNHNKLKTYSGTIPMLWPPSTSKQQYNMTVQEIRPHNDNKNDIVNPMSPSRSDKDLLNQ